MPTSVLQGYRFSDELRRAATSSACMGPTVSRVLHDLQNHSTWFAAAALNLPLPYARPESMRKNIVFDYSSDSRGDIVEFVDAPEDESDFAW